MPDELPDEPEGFDRPPSFFPYDEREQDDVPHESGELVRVEIEGVFAAESNGNVQRFVILTDGDRKLPIHIGPFEAQAISYPLESSQPDRPLTHDLLKNILDRVELAIDRVVIDDLWSTTFYAKLYIRFSDEELEIDSRPSDAIALAVRAQAPIYVAEQILASHHQQSL